MQNRNRNRLHRGYYLNSDGPEELFYILMRSKSDCALRSCFGLCFLDASNQNTPRHACISSSNLIIVMCGAKRIHLVTSQE